MEARKADYSKFQELNVQILGIGSSNPFSQKTFADSLKLPYPLLSDFPNMQVIRSYGVLGPAQVTARRAFFLVDQQGVVRGKWLVENKEIFPSEELLKTAQVMAQQR
jgi:peroxiredoxin